MLVVSPALKIGLRLNPIPRLRLRGMIRAGLYIAGVGGGIRTMAYPEKRT